MLPAWVSADGRISVSDPLDGVPLVPDQRWRASAADLTGSLRCMFPGPPLAAMRMSPPSVDGKPETCMASHVNLISGDLCFVLFDGPVCTYLFWR